MSEFSWSAKDVARRFADLRLNGIAKSFPKRYEEAVAGKMSILEFLGMLLEEETAGRKQRRFERLVKTGNLDMTDCIERYDFDLARKKGVEATIVRDLISGEYIRKVRHIVLGGAIGTGKTKLARTLGFEACRRDFTAIFENTRNLVEKLYAMRNAYGFAKIYRRYVHADVLILDDLSYMPYAPDRVEYLFRIVFDRTEKKTGPIIVTTNTDVKEWWSFFPSKPMGMAFSDRILGGALGIKYTGTSIRRDPPGRNEKDKENGKAEKPENEK